MRHGFDKSRHVLQIIADGNPGGGTTFVLGLCDDLSKNHFCKVSVVTKPDSYASRRASELGIATYNFDFFTSRFRPSHTVEAQLPTRSDQTRFGTRAWGTCCDCIRTWSIGQEFLSSRLYRTWLSFRKKALADEIAGLARRKTHRGPRESYLLCVEQRSRDLTAGRHPGNEAA